MAKRRRRLEEELERELEQKGGPKLAELDPAKRAGVLEELQRSSGNRALQQVVAGQQQLQREAAPKQAPSLRSTRTYMRVHDIKGPLRLKGHEDEFELVKYSHKTESPRDVHSGQATGVRRHAPVTVILPTSEGTVPFRQHFEDNSPIKQIVVFRPSQTITLTNASVVVIEDLDDDQVLVQFVYEKIEWTTPGEGGGAAHESPFKKEGT